MSSDPASLQNLHDIVVPQPVPFWPPAPGWYVVLGLALLLVLRLVIRSVVRFRRNAYRRAALAELNTLPDSSAVAQQVAALLKRTALAAFPREQVASLTGSSWLDWLTETSGMQVPAAVRSVLTDGIYGRASQQDLKDLREFAAEWIRRHRSAIAET